MAEDKLAELRKKRRELGRIIREADRISGYDARAEANRRNASAWRREQQEHVKEIGPPPAIVDPDRRESCRLDLLKYLTTYHPEAFPLAFGDDHLYLIEQTQKVLLEGGQLAAAMPRGSGKTTIFQRAQIWAALYGHRRYPMLLAADDTKYKSLLRGIKIVLETNELLFADFPEVIHPIWALERVAIRARFQTIRRNPSYINWGTTNIVFATCEESIERGNAGAVIAGGGLTGAAVRGGVMTLPDGTMIRPDAVLIDDPQTRRSAKSTVQNQEREDILNGDVLGMAGPGKSIAALVACTVIYRGDLADRLLDRERNASWHPVKVQMIKAWPKNLARWEEYDAVRREELLGEKPNGTANGFYEQHRAEMDEGSLTYWPARILPGRLSAIQSAMDDYYSDPRSFMAEKQNTPDANIASDLPELNALDMVRRMSDVRRGQVPPEATVLTAHIDVQARILFWLVTAWTQSGGGQIVDYGAWPQQNRRFYKLTDIKRELTEHYPGFDSTAALKQAIADCIQSLAERSFQRLDGATMRIDRGMVDARYQTDCVEAGIRAAMAPNWMPSYGVGIRAKDAPIDKWIKKRGVRRGHYFVVQKPDRRLYPSCFYDTNYWKSQVHEALITPVGHQSSIVLYREQQSHHQMLAEHLAAERAVRVEARGRIVDEWDLPSFSPDNHWWDCLVGTQVSAAMSGIIRGATAHDRPAEQQPERPARRVRNLSI